MALTVPHRCVTKTREIFLSPLEPGVSEAQIKTSFHISGVNVTSVRLQQRTHDETRFAFIMFSNDVDVTKALDLQRVNIGGNIVRVREKKDRTEDDLKNSSKVNINAALRYAAEIDLNINQLLEESMGLPSTPSEDIYNGCCGEQHEVCEEYKVDGPNSRHVDQVTNRPIVAPEAQPSSDNTVDTQQTHIPWTVVRDQLTVGSYCGALLNDVSYTSSHTVPSSSTTRRIVYADPRTRYDHLGSQPPVHSDRNVINRNNDISTPSVNCNVSLPDNAISPYSGACNESSEINKDNTKESMVMEWSTTNDILPRPSRHSPPYVTDLFKPTNRVAKNTESNQADLPIQPSCTKSFKSLDQCLDPPPLKLKIRTTNIQTVKSSLKYEEPFEFKYNSLNLSNSTKVQTSTPVNKQGKPKRRYDEPVYFKHAYNCSQANLNYNHVIETDQSQQITMVDQPITSYEDDTCEDLIQFDLSPASDINLINFSSDENVENSPKIHDDLRCFDPLDFSLQVNTSTDVSSYSDDTTPYSSRAICSDSKPLSVNVNTQIKTPVDTLTTLVNTPINTQSHRITTSISTSIDTPADAPMETLAVNTPVHTPVNIPIRKLFSSSEHHLTRQSDIVNEFKVTLHEAEKEYEKFCQSKSTVDYEVFLKLQNLEPKISKTIELNEFDLTLYPDIIKIIDEVKLMECDLQLKTKFLMDNVEEHDAHLEEVQDNIEELEFKIAISNGKILIEKIHLLLQP